MKDRVNVAEVGDVCISNVLEDCWHRFDLSADVKCASSKKVRIVAHHSMTSFQNHRRQYCADVTLVPRHHNAHAIVSPSSRRVYAVATSAQQLSEAIAPYATTWNCRSNG